MGLMGIDNELTLSKLRETRDFSAPTAMILPRRSEKAQYPVTRLRHGNIECCSLSVPEPFGRRH